MDADGAVDAQTAPTAPWKTLRVSHKLPQGLLSTKSPTDRLNHPQILLRNRSFLVHPAHSSGRTAHRGCVRLLLGDVRDQRLGCEQQRRDRTGVLQRCAHDHRRVDDAGLDQVLVLLGLCVEALVLVLGLAYFLNDDGALKPGVLRDPPHRFLERAADDVDADPLVAF